MQDNFRYQVNWSNTVIKIVLHFAWILARVEQLKLKGSWCGGGVGGVQLTLYNVLSHQSDSGWKEAAVEAGPVGAQVVAWAYPLEQAVS